VDVVSGRTEPSADKTDYHIATIVQAVEAAEAAELIMESQQLIRRNKVTFNQCQRDFKALPTVLMQKSYQLSGNKTQSIIPRKSHTVTKF
jgi:hypothetical protein